MTERGVGSGTSFPRKFLTDVSIWHSSFPTDIIVSWRTLNRSALVASV
jgi:hypothetical protein